MKADIENGYTRLANDIHDALAMLDLSGREFRVLHIIIRRTYGYQKKNDWIALDQFVEATGINKPNVSKILSDLADRNVITKDGRGHIKKIGINTNITEWVSRGNIIKNDNFIESDKLSNPITNVIENDNSVIESDNKRYRKRQPQKKKENRNKEKKDIYANLDFSSWPEKPSEQVWKDWKTHRTKKRASVTQTVIDTMGRELTLAAEQGYLVDYCLAQQMEAGWQGFKFDWLLNREQKNAQRQPGNTGKSKHEQSIDAIDAAFGGSGRTLEGDFERVETDEPAAQYHG